MKRFNRQTLVFSITLLMVLGMMPVHAAKAVNLGNAESSRQALRPPALKTVAENGFKKGTEDFSVTLGHGWGAKIFGSGKRHDLLLASGHWGWIATTLMGKHHWYQGTLEPWAELFGGLQYHPRDHYVTGLTIGLRYHFVTASRWVPFFDAGVGLAATDIGKPDLGSTFEFNLQIGLGIQYFINPHLALGGHARLFHLSNGGLTSSNMGVNSFLYLCDVTWFF